MANRLGNQLQSNLEVFEKNNQVDMRSRQDREEQELRVINETMARLETTLNREVQRRDDTNKAIQGMFEAHMATVQDKLEAGLVVKLDGLIVSVDALNKRVENMEKEFTEARECYTRDTEDKSTMVAKDLVSLRQKFQQEFAERKDRETLIIAKLRDLQERSEQKLNTDLKLLEEQTAELNESLQVSVRQEESRFQEWVFQELAALRNGLTVESQTRQHSDDEIVSALNQYTSSVTEAMRVINQK